MEAGTATAEKDARSGALGMYAREHMVLTGRTHIVDDERQIRKGGTQREQRADESIASRFRTRSGRMLGQVDSDRSVEKCSVTGREDRRDIGIETADDIDIASSGCRSTGYIQREAVWLTSCASAMSVMPVASAQRQTQMTKGRERRIGGLPEATCWMSDRAG